MYSDDTPQDTTERVDYDRGGGGTRIYVGGITNEVKKEDLEGEFGKFGKLNSVWVAYNPPGFAFVEYNEKKDAETACEDMNNTEMMGCRLRVEISRGRGRGGGGGRRGSFSRHRGYSGPSNGFAGREPRLRSRSPRSSQQ